MSALFELAGNAVAPGELQHPWARAFARYVSAPENHLLELRECRQRAGVEEIAIVVHPDVPQRPRFDIQYEEPLLVTFDLSSRILPEVTARRRDFPQVPHLNLRPAGWPKSLCLFGERHEELKVKWTPALLGERILWWLAETARGTVHREDQALEPFIGGFTRPLIIPPDIFTDGNAEVLEVYSAAAGPSGEVLLAERPDRVPAGLRRAQFTLFPFILPPQVHGVIHFEPQTLQELQRLCHEAGVDLLGQLRRRLQEKISRVRADSNGTILVLAIPKTREAGGEVESTDTFGFRCAAPTNPGQLVDIGPGKLGELLKILASYSGIVGGGRGSYFPTVSTAEAVDAAAAGIAVSTLTPRLILTPERAARLSGHSHRETRRIFAVGQGALGSQLFGNLARQGYGQWDLLDEDYLAPHNSVRHEIFGRRFGLPKAGEMASRANEMFTGPPIAAGFEVNILNPKEKSTEIAERAKAADIILDMSASVVVARHLAINIESDAKRIAAFLSPSGLDLVVMSEGGSRSVPLDVCELQYLRAVVNAPSLEGHLIGDDERVRYGGSCSDLTARISQELVGLHAAIGAKAVRDAVEAEEPMLSIWRCERERMSVDRVDFTLHDAIIRTAEDWTVVTDDGLIAKVMGYRSAKLPNETCGVLLGVLDTERRRLYIVDALPAPPDSVEEQSGCVRGIAGLEEAVNSTAARTMNQIDYIGEWHSHPDRTTCLPSERDLVQMAWVKSKMHPEGKPALMLIACEGGNFSLLVSEPE